MSEEDESVETSDDGVEVVAYRSPALEEISEHLDEPSEDTEDTDDSEDASAAEEELSEVDQAALDALREEEDKLREDYQNSLKRIGSLPDLPMRRSVIVEVMSHLDIEESVWWIDQLIRGALWGRSPEMDAMIACSDWLIRLRQEDDYDRIQAMFQAAYEADRSSVLFLLRDPPAERAMPPDSKLPEVRLPSDRGDITLGERRFLATKRDRHLLERLLLDPSPLVIRKLLRNPHLRLQEAMNVATRRPTVPELLMEVLLHPRWFKEAKMREAIVRNPYTPTGISLKLLPTLNIATLRKIKYATDLHDIVQEAAEIYVELREQRTAPWKV